MDKPFHQIAFLGMDIGFKGLNPLACVIPAGIVQKMRGLKIEGIHRPAVKSGELDTPPFTMKGFWGKGEISMDKKRGFSGKM